MLTAVYITCGHGSEVDGESSWNRTGVTCVFSGATHTHYYCMLIMSFVHVNVRSLQTWHRLCLVALDILVSLTFCVNLLLSEHSNIIQQTQINILISNISLFITFFKMWFICCLTLHSLPIIPAIWPQPSDIGIWTSDWYWDTSHQSIIGRSRGWVQRVPSLLKIMDLPLDMIRYATK